MNPFYIVCAMVAVLLLIILALLWQHQEMRHILTSDDKHTSNRNKILEYLRRHGRAQNHELRKYVKCSAKSVVNYCDQLEKEGKIKQIGKTGKWAHYTLA